MMRFTQADFNAIEYLQKVRFYLPRLRDAGVRRVACVLNADAAQCRTLAELLDVPDDVELFADPTGAAGRKFGVSRGFRPDDGALSPYVNLLVVGSGRGPPREAEALLALDVDRRVDVEAAQVHARHLEPVGGALRELGLEEDEQVRLAHAHKLGDGHGGNVVVLRLAAPRLRGRRSPASLLRWRAAESIARGRRRRWHSPELLLG